MAAPDLLEVVDETDVDRFRVREDQGIDAAAVEDGLELRLEATDLEAEILTGTFDTAAYLEQGDGLSGLSKQGTRGGYTIWDTGANGGTAVGEKDGEIVRVTAEERDPTRLARKLVDTRRGEHERYVDTDEHFRKLVATLGTGTTVTGRRHEPAEDLGGGVGEGVRLALEGSESTIAASAIFESARAVDEEAAEDWAKTLYGFYPSMEPSVDTNGSVATVETTMETSEVDQLWFEVEPRTGTDPATDTVPDLSFTFEYDPSEGGSGTGILTITHAGGRSVQSDQLLVLGREITAVDGADLTDPGSWEGSVSGTLEGEPAVAEGDSVDVGVRSNYVVTVNWGDVPDTLVSLAQHRGPDA